MHRRILKVCLASAILCLTAVGAQNESRETAINRSSAFLLGSSRFDPTGLWQGLFCKSDDGKVCLLAEVSVTESTSSKEGLANGQIVPILVYSSRPGYVASLFAKDLKIPNGSIESVLDKRLEISTEARSVKWRSENFQVKREKFNLIVTNTGTRRIEQSFPLFMDPRGLCEKSDTPDDRLWTVLEWVGDLDRDQKPDFRISAGAYKSCAVTILTPPEQTDPAHLLILSSRAAGGQIGKMFVPGNRRQP
jgi:hypothetical protein